jgi:hypothetical protein
MTLFHLVLVVEAFTTIAMQEDLDKERNTIMKQQAKRGELIERVMGVTVGIFIWGLAAYHG